MDVAKDVQNGKPSCENDPAENGDVVKEQDNSQIVHEPHQPNQPLKCTIERVIKKKIQQWNFFLK